MQKSIFEHGNWIFYNFSILVFKFGLLVIVDVLQMLNIFKKITNQKSKQ